MDSARHESAASPKAFGRFRELPDCLPNIGRLHVTTSDDFHSQRAPHLLNHAAARETPQLGSTGDDPSRASATVRTSSNPPSHVPGLLRVQIRTINHTTGYQKRGRRRRARVPPSGDVSSVTEPPYNSARSATIASPKPDPPTCWSRDLGGRGARSSRHRKLTLGMTRRRTRFGTPRHRPPGWSARTGGRGWRESPARWSDPAPALHVWS